MICSQYLKPKKGVKFELARRSPRKCRNCERCAGNTEQAGAQRFPPASTARKIPPWEQNLFAKLQGDGGHPRAGCDTTSGDALHTWPCCPEHLQQTNPPRSPQGDGAVPIPQPQGIMASKGRARIDLNPSPKVPKIPWPSGHS